MGAMRKAVSLCKKGLWGAPLKRLLTPLALAILLEILSASGLPAKHCHLPQFPDHPKAFRSLRNRYEDARIAGDETWKNCSHRQLQLPRGRMYNLTKWEKLEAVEAELALAIPVLRDIPEPAFAKDATKVLQFLIPFQENLLACIQCKPPSQPESGPLQAFRAEIQRFNASSAKQSPKCLEAAIGLNVVRLLEEDLGQVRRRSRCLRCPRHPRPSSN